MNEKQRATYKRLIGRLYINKDDLSEEIVQQPQLYFEAGRLAVQLAHERDESREAQKRISSDVYMDLQDSSEKKLTVKAIEMLVEQDPRHTKARLAYKKASERCGLAEKLEQAWASRGYLLKDLAAMQLTELAHARDKSDAALVARYQDARKARNGSNPKSNSR